MEFVKLAHFAESVAAVECPEERKERLLAFAGAVEELIAAGSPGIRPYIRYLDMQTERGTRYGTIAFCANAS